MSYPPPGNYGYPPPSTGYPQTAPYGQQQYGQGYPTSQTAAPGLGFEGLNLGSQPGGMPMPGGAPGYGNTPYPQAHGQPGYPAPGQGYNVNPSFGGAAYAAAAATGFKTQQSSAYPQQPNQQQAPPSNYPHQTSHHHNTNQPSYPSQTSYPSSLPKVSPVVSEPKTQGTIRDHTPFNVQQDAEILRKAMKGFGTDEKAIIHIITSRSNAQRQKIKLEFATMYGKDLLKELKSELSGNFETAVLGMLMTPDEFDAYQMHIAMKGLGTDEKALIEILCSRTNSEIKAATSTYNRLYKSNLEKDLISETSGHFKRLLVSLVQGSRLENEPLNQQKSAEDARALYQAGEARWGTDESRFNAVLSLRSNANLRLIFQQYKQFSSRTVEQAIISEMSGDLKNGMLAIVKCAQDKPRFFAEKLYHSMKGLGTDDGTLMRIMISRSEIDLVQIKKAFSDMYGKTLARFISDDCSGDYKKLLIGICGTP